NTLFKKMRSSQIWIYKIMDEAYIENKYKTPEYMDANRVLDFIANGLYINGLGVTDENLITPDTALLVASQVIGRRVEEEYLETRAQSSDAPRNSRDIDATLGMQANTAKLHDILLTAKEGDF